MIEPHDPTSEDITLEIEIRPSKFTGHAFWAVIKYKDQMFDELLPSNWGALTDLERDEKYAEVARRLQSQLRPILLAEDRKSRLTLLPNEQGHLPVESEQ